MSEHGYFRWLTNKVYDDRSSVTYQKLFYKLYETEFVYVLSADSRRASDGCSLRDRYMRETGDSIDINRPCSVLEMLIALANRCEEDIMHNDSLGDRTGQWFWEMIINIGFGNMNDTKYKEEKVDALLYKFMCRDYDDNGTGCAFRTTRNVDMRRIELWYQMQYHITEI